MENQKRKPKTHLSENSAGRGKPLGWGTLKFRYAARSLEPPLGRFCKHRKHPLILQGLEKCHRTAPPPVEIQPD
jgi:hypothetical protein